MSTIEDPILFVTVGGSYQPVLTAIQANRPEYTCFFCTGKDASTAQTGSRSQIEGRGACISTSPDAAPSLPNIPTQAGLNQDQYEILEIPADDLDHCVQTMIEALRTLGQRFPNAPLIADYSGGTKTMTAALVVAALENDRVRLELVTGARGDLKYVCDGTEESTVASVEGIRLQRAMAPHLAAWEHYFYGAAKRGIRAVNPPTNPQLATQRRIALDLSRAFDAWDRFDHQQAWGLIETYQPRVGKSLAYLIKFLSILADDKEPRQESARLWDLWLNAQRRADQCRYDDAVARLYRLLEWTAQWLLRSRADLDTADLPRERLPKDIQLNQSRDGRSQAGLDAAWRLVAELLDGPARKFASEQLQTMRNHLSTRNQSILAHGFKTIGEPEWQAFNGWMETHFLPMLATETANTGLTKPPQQLPKRAFWNPFWDTLQAASVVGG